MKNLKFNYRNVLEAKGKKLADAALRLSSVFTDGYYLWLAKLWDDNIGGFYYANSSRDNDGFLPDIESTTQALGVISTLGISSTADLPTVMKEKLAEFAKSLQDPEDGYFYHPQWGKDITPSRRSRDLNSAIGVIRSVGAVPNYPTALDRIKASAEGADSSTVPEQFRSKERFLEWLKELDVTTKSYPKGHLLDSMSAEIKAAGLKDVCVDYLNSLQHSDTGLWETVENYQSANGMLKISTVYPRFCREFPNTVNAAKTQIRIALSSEPTTGITDIYNPWVALGILYETSKNYAQAGVAEQIKALIDDSAPELLDATREKLLTFRRDDGSFSYLHRGSCPISQGARASLGECEGDVNASALALVTYRKPFSVLGIDTGAMTDEDDKKAFFEVLGYGKV